MSFYGFALVCIAAVLTALAQILLNKGIGIAGGFSFDGLVSLSKGLIRLLLTPIFLTGFLVYFGASIVWFRVLANEPMSIAYPLLVSLTFALVTLASVFLIGEPITSSKMVGLAIIVLGIVIISLS